METFDKAKYEKKKFKSSKNTDSNKEFYYIEEVTDVKYNVIYFKGIHISYMIQENGTQFYINRNNIAFLGMNSIEEITDEEWEDEACFIGMSVNDLIKL